MYISMRPGIHLLVQLCSVATCVFAQCILLLRPEVNYDNLLPGIKRHVLISNLDIGKSIKERKNRLIKNHYKKNINDVSLNA